MTLARPRSVLVPALVALLVGGVAPGCEDEGPAVDPATISTDPPANAAMLPREITPAGVISMTRMGSDFTHHWVSDPGWDGEVIKTRKSGGILTFSVKMHAATAVGGEFWVICQAPLADDTARSVAEGGLARFKGRITQVEFTKDPTLSGDKIHLDHVKVTRFNKPG
ncbi:MAG: hypothetical protein ACF8SC_08155 [Phycisphaerales bacterium JB037]